MTEKQIIEKLTEEQEALLPVWADKWIEIGRGTNQPSKEEAEAVIDECYRCADLEPPTQKYWVGSPKAGAIAAAKLLKYGTLDTDEEVERGEITAQLSRCGYGSQDAFWLSFYDYFIEVCDVELPQISGLIKAAKLVGWWWPFDEAVVISPQPLELNLDNDGRLHSEAGMAVRYSDGWGFYAWHGIQVPERLILDPGSYTSEEILGEQNAELRRCMVEKIGVEVLIDNATKVHEDAFGTLYNIAVEDDDDVRFVEVTNATANSDGSFSKYYLQVPPQMERAKQAVAWTFDVEEDAYQPVAES